MTPQEARAALEVVREDEREVNAAERRFCELVFEGKTNQDAYLEAFQPPSVNTASSNSTRLLREARVQRYLQRLYDAAIGVEAEKLRPWVDLLPLSQAVIVATAQGKLRNRLAYEAAVYLTNRVLGMPTATLDLNVQNHERIAGATKMFTTRMAAERKRTA